MRTLFDPTDHADTLARLGRLTPETQPLWGTMSAGRMVCHLCDYFDLALGHTSARPYGNAVARKAVRFVVFGLRLPFPKNVMTLPAFLVTEPGDFEADRGRLEKQMEEFASRKGEADWPVNPVFGKLSGKQWADLAYRHNDHHLRQFGV
jgi:hypothetical protein